MAENHSSSSASVDTTKTIPNENSRSDHGKIN